MYYHVLQYAVSNAWPHRDDDQQTPGKEIRHLEKRSEKNTDSRFQIQTRYSSDMESTLNQTIKEEETGTHTEK